MQSLVNLVNLFTAKEIGVLASHHDLGETSTLGGITVHQWNINGNEQAYYLDGGERNYKAVKHLIEQYAPSVIYINGLYSLTFVLYPLIFWSRNLKTSVKLVWAPRGMLQEGALKVKPLKKKIFLTGLKLAGLSKGVTWHATDAQEALDIKKQFGNNAKIQIASNIPKQPLGQVAPIAKAKNQLRLIYLSLITEKKNLLFALKWLDELNLPVTFDIYGPVKDKSYWQECLTLINNAASNVSVNYRQDVKPGDVQSTFSAYHALLLPTKGENFGHAIYECLSVGRPVIISTETPWKNLEKDKVGFDIPLSSEALFKKAITKMFEMDGEEYAVWCNNAHALAHKYWAQNDFTALYSFLFN